MDASNKNGKRYANVRILTLLSRGKKVNKCLHYSIEVHHSYLVFGFFIYLSHINFIEKWVAGMTEYLSDPLLTLVNCFILISKQSFIN